MRYIAVLCLLAMGARIYVAVNDFLAGVNVAGVLLMFSAIVTPLALGAICWELADLTEL